MSKPLMTPMHAGDPAGFQEAWDHEFSGELWFWRGPAPWYFITVPEDECRELKAESPEVTYGWGMIPATVRVGATEWRTSLFPKEGRYIIPIRTSVREAEALAEGDTVTVQLTIGR